MNELHEIIPAYSRQIEVPCCIGEKIYRIFKHRVIEYVIKYMNLDIDHTMIKPNIRYWASGVDKALCLSDISFTADDIGDIIFTEDPRLNKEEK